MFRLAAFVILTCAGVAQAQIIEEARTVALNYSRWLPNLICTEHIQRFADFDTSGKWVAVDTLTAQVTYFQLEESYQLIAHNNYSANQRLDNLAGAVSKGEFGSFMRWIFDPAAKAAFEPKGQETIRGQRALVFSYRVDREGSRLELRALSKSVIAAFHGVVYIDEATRRVLRLTAESEAPADFPVRDSYVSIDYDWAKIGDGQYLVPVRAETGMTDPAPPPHPDPMAQWARHRPTPTGPLPPAIPTKYRNVLEFRGYRKFAADSKLTFDTPK